MSDDLKPCPFCLTDGDERLIELLDTFDAGHIAHVHCTHCGAERRPISTRDELLAFQAEHVHCRPLWARKAIAP